MTSSERTSTEARGETGERISQDGVKLLEAVGEGNHGHEVRPNRHLLVERLRQSIAAGNYLTPVKIDATVERLYRELFGPCNTRSEQPRRQLLRLFRRGPLPRQQRHCRLPNQDEPGIWSCGARSGAATAVGKVAEALPRRPRYFATE